MASELKKPQRDAMATLFETANLVAFPEPLESMWEERSQPYGKREPRVSGSAQANMDDLDDIEDYIDDVLDDLDSVAVPSPAVSDVRGPGVPVAAAVPAPAAAASISPAREAPVVPVLSSALPPSLVAPVLAMPASLMAPGTLQAVIPCVG
jgi:hypothetical protein